MHREKSESAVILKKNLPTQLLGVASLKYLKVLKGRLLILVSLTPTKSCVILLSTQGKFREQWTP